MAGAGAGGLGTLAINYGKTCLTMMSSLWRPYWSWFWSFLVQFIGDFFRRKLATVRLGYPMNRINVNQIKQVGAFIFLLSFAIGLGVLVGNLSIIKEICFMPCLFQPCLADDLPLLSRKIKGVGSIFIVGCDRILLSPFTEAAHENEPRLAVPSCHGRR